MSHLGVTSDNLHAIRLSNDRDNIALVVRTMKYPANSFCDLNFLVPASDTSGGSQQHKKFVIFFDNKKEATSAGRYLRGKLPIDERDRIIWFLSDMSADFKEEGITNLASGKLLGICATDSFGMVSTQTSTSTHVLSNMPSGYRFEGHRSRDPMESYVYPCMLWQRFGRGAWDNAIQATALLFVELKNLDPVAPLEGRKQKAAETGGGAQLKSKRAKKEKPAPLVLDENSTGEEFWKARKEVYHEPISDEKQVELDQVLDDVINAEGRGIGCRRTPFKVYFDDDDEHYGLSTHWGQRGSYLAGTL
jgi:hypothetical protein